jgi:transcriptional antiterminator NusG
MREGTTGEIYAAQVMTGYEEKYISRFRRLFPELNAIEIYYPKRELEERKGGKINKVQRGIFSGYIFIRAEEEELKEHQREFRGTEKFVRFLRTNSDIRALKGRDKELAAKFINLPDAVAETSTVYFSERDRVEVISGALKGMEGEITKIDRRKGRARVNLKLFNKDMYIDFSIKEIRQGQA